MYKEPTDMRVHRIFQFLTIMKFNIPEEQIEDFQGLLLSGKNFYIYQINIPVK